jgi:hypothetical protein
MRHQDSIFKREAAPHSLNRDKTFLRGPPLSVGKRAGHFPRTRYRGDIKSSRRRIYRKDVILASTKFPPMQSSQNRDGRSRDTSASQISTQKATSDVAAEFDFSAVPEAPQTFPTFPTLRRPPPIHPQHPRPYRVPNSYSGPLSETPLRYSVGRFAPTILPCVRDGSEIARLPPPDTARSQSDRTTRTHRNDPRSRADVHARDGASVGCVWQSTRPPWPTAREERFARQCRQCEQSVGVGGEDGQHVYLRRCRRRS